MRRTLAALILVAVAACTGDDEPGAARSSTTTTTTTTTITAVPAEATPVTLVLGHCYIEPVTIDGDEWVQRMGPGDSGIGSGGGVPSGFTGSGNFVVLSDTEARYKDEDGLEVPFVLDDGTLPPRECR